MLIVFAGSREVIGTLTVVAERFVETMRSAELAPYSMTCKKWSSPLTVAPDS